MRPLNTSWNIPAYWTYRTLHEEGVDVPSHMKKMGYDIPEYGIESLLMAEELRSPLPNIPTGFQTIANNGDYLKRYMVEQIIDRDGDVVYKHEADPVRVHYSSNGNDYAGSLRGLLRLVLQRPLSHGLAKSIQHWRVLTGLENRYDQLKWGYVVDVIHTKCFFRRLDRP